MGRAAGHLPVAYLHFPCADKLLQPRAAPGTGELSLLGVKGRVKPAPRPLQSLQGSALLSSLSPPRASLSPGNGTRGNGAGLALGEPAGSRVDI